jgi:hypothetical protein
MITALLCFILLAGAATASATQPAAAQPFILGAGSTFQQGCFPPCLCPLGDPRPIEGVFWLTLQSANRVMSTYTVSDLEWTVDPGGDEIVLTGTGVYRLARGSRPQHRLELDLSIAGEPPEHFDSGSVPGGQKFPNFSLTLSLNGLDCFDTVIEMQAMPNLGCPYAPGDDSPTDPTAGETPRFRPRTADHWGVIPEPLTPPGYLVGSQHGPCSAGNGDGGYPWCGDDTFSWSSMKRTVRIVHHNAAYNCCAQEIVVTLDADGGIQRLTETEALMQPCDCLCCYEITTTLAGLEPGDQAIEYCWADEELGEACTTLVITVNE